MSSGVISWPVTQIGKRRDGIIEEKLRYRWKARDASSIALRWVVAFAIPGDGGEKSRGLAERCSSMAAGLTRR